MKILLINGSPRRNGNSSKIIATVKDALINEHDVETINLMNLDISHCTGCLTCSEGMGCIIEDDFEKSRLKVEESDLLIFISPVYFNSVTSISKAFIDRFECSYMERFVKFIKPKKVDDKFGFYVIHGGMKQKNTEFECIVNIFDLFFKSNGISNYSGIILEETDRKDIDLQQVTQKVIEHISRLGGKKQ